MSTRDQLGTAFPAGYMRKLKRLEASYLQSSDPRIQSGYGGGARRWKRERELILDAVEGDGSFLDVGCANGYLLECLVRWARKRGINLIPFGVDLGAGLIQLAQARFPEYQGHFWVANAWDWWPPRKFDYVYALYDCVPEELLPAWTRRMLGEFLEPGGTVIIGAYGSKSQKIPAWDVAGELARHGFAVAGSSSQGRLPVVRIAWLRK
jgi:SAM-dependent methyltransferase